MIIFTLAGPDGQLGPIISCPEDQKDIQLGPNDIAIDGEWNNTVYYADMTDPEAPVITEKPVIPYTQTGNQLTGLPQGQVFSWIVDPIGVHVSVTGPLTDEFDVTDGELIYDPPMSGTYTLTLTAIHHLPTVVTMEIV